MADLLSFIPLAQETIDQIRQRLDADANAGGDPNSESYIDTTEGGYFWDMTQAAAIELARLWDFASTEVPAVAFPAFAYGEYLDDHGEALGLDRKDAVQAIGTVTFTGAAGTLIAADTEVGTVPAAGEDAIVFATDVDVTISGTSVDVAVTASEAGAAGNVGPNNVTVLITPTPGVSAVTNAAPMGEGADIESDEQYRARILLLLSSPQGAGNIGDYERWALAYPGVGTVTVTPVWNGAGTVHVVITDPAQNPTPESVTYGLQDQLDPPGVLTSTTAAITLPVATVPVGSTAGFTSSGSIRVGTQMVSYTGITSNSFTGCTGGSGAVASGERVAQNFGQGRGLAPVGAVVTVDTISAIVATVAATVAHEPGYSLDGAAGTIATRADLTAAIQDYIDGLGPGDDVILNHVIASFFTVSGVLDVSGVTINGTAADLAIDPTSVAQPGTPTLT